jgi:PAS domain S-box-containing protein
MAMTAGPLHILLVEDNPGDALLIKEMLAESGRQTFTLEPVSRLSDGLARLAQGGVDLTLLDLDLPDSRGLETFSRVHEQSPEVPVVILTGLADDVLALTAVREGAQDFLFKNDITPALLRRSMRYATERKQGELALERERRKLFSLLNNLPAFVNLMREDFSIHFSNRKFKELFGEPGGKTCYEVVHGRNQPCADCQALNIIASRLPQQVEVTIPFSGRTYEIFRYPFCSDGSNLILNLGIDITDRKQAEEELRWEMSVKTAVADLSTALISQDSAIEDIARLLLHHAKELTSSLHGYVAVIDPVSGDAISFTLTEMMQDQCRVSGDDCRIAFCKGADGLYPGLTGYALNTLEAFYTNAPASHPAFGRIPEGHIPINNFLSVPTIIDSRIAGQIAVANSQKDYTPHDLQAIQRLSKYYALAIRRQRHEQALRESEERFRVIFQQAAVGFAQLETATGRFVKINQKYCDIVGYTEGEMLASDFMAITHPDDLQADMDNMQELREGKIRDFSMEKRYLRKDGRVIWVKLTVSPMWHPGERPDYHIAVVEDITARKQGERALQRQQEELQIILDSVPALIFYKDLKNHFVRVNKAMADLTGVAAEEIEGKTAFDLYPNQAEKYWKDDQAVISSGNPKRNIIETMDTPAGHRWVQTDKLPYRDEHGELIGVIGFGIDISKRRAAEQKLLESEKNLRYLATQLMTAQEAERKRISSELHDELGHALLTLRVFLKGIDKHLLPSQVSLKKDMKPMLKYIDKVVSNVRRLYLDLSPGDLEDLGLTAALQGLIDEFAARHKKIKWTVSLDDIDNLFAENFQTTIVYRLLQEALTNIGKHAEPTKVVIELKRSLNKILFTIEDNGRGFDVNEIFSSSRRKQTVGLAAMKERIKMLGGTAEIWSRQKLGTRITLNIPIPQGGR